MALAKSKYTAYYNIQYLDKGREDNRISFMLGQFWSLEENIGESKPEKEPKVYTHSVMVPVILVIFMLVLLLSRLSCNLEHSLSMAAVTGLALIYLSRSQFSQAWCTPSRVSAPQYPIPGR